MATLNGAAVQVLVWNYHDDLVTVAATPVHLAVTVPASFGPRVRVSHLRVDESHGDAYTVWVSQGMPASPSAAELAALQQAMDPASLVADTDRRGRGGRLGRHRLRSAPVRRLAGHASRPRRARATVAPNGDGSTDDWRRHRRLRSRRRAGPAAAAGVALGVAATTAAAFVALAALLLSRAAEPTCRRSAPALLTRASDLETVRSSPAGFDDNSGWRRGADLFLTIPPASEQ